MDWHTLLTSVITSLGGTLGITLIFLRSIKKRSETYIDNVLQHSLDKKLEEYKLILNKQIANYEIFSKRYNECLDITILQLTIIEQNTHIIFDGITQCINEGLTLDFIFQQPKLLTAKKELEQSCTEINKANVLCKVCFDKDLLSQVENLSKKTSEYIEAIDRKMVELTIDQSVYQELIVFGEGIDKIIDDISKFINKNTKRLSGEK